MKTLIKFVWNMLAVIGLVTVIFVAVASYVVWSNPFLQSVAISVATPSDTTTESGSGEAADQNTLLSEEQEQSLRSAGIDPAIVPGEITPEMEQCFVDKLGQARVNEIVAGAKPTTLEMLKASVCLE